MTTTRRIGAALTLMILSATILIAEESVKTTAPPPWGFSLGAGLAVTSGNTDTRNLNLSLNAKWDPKTKHLFKSEALFLKGTKDGEDQVDKVAAFLRYEYLLSERTFAFGQLSYLRDPFRDISLLVSPVVGAGLHLIRSDTRTLDVDASLGAILEKNEGFDSETDMSYQIGESAEWIITKSSKLTQGARGLWKWDQSEDYLLHFDVGFTNSISARTELKVSWLLDYKNRPSDPTLEKDDSAFFVAFVFKL